MKSKLLVLVVSVSFLVLGYYFYNFSSFFSKHELKLEILTENERMVWPMNKNRVIPIKTKQGSLTVVLEKREAYVRESSCPDKICVKTGKINKKGQLIICAPNGVMLRIIQQKNRIGGIWLSY